VAAAAFLGRFSSLGEERGALICSSFHQTHAEKHAYFNVFFWIILLHILFKAKNQRSCFFKLPVAVA